MFRLQGIETDFLYERNYLIVNRLYRLVKFNSNTIIIYLLIHLFHFTSCRRHCCSFPLFNFINILKFHFRLLVFQFVKIFFYNSSSFLFWWRSMKILVCFSDRDFYFLSCLFYHSRLKRNWRTSEYNYLSTVKKYNMLCYKDTFLFFSLQFWNMCGYLKSTPWNRNDWVVASIA